MKAYILFFAFCGICPALADETCGNGYTLSSTISSLSTIAPRGGTCYAGYTMYSGNLGNFRFVPAAPSVGCPNGQHMSGGTCVNNTVGNCATGFYDATINSVAAVAPLGGKCHSGYQSQQTVRNVAYLIRSAVATCGSGEYPTASGCASNPIENCPTNFFAPVPSTAFVRAGDSDTCPTNYSLYQDMDFCRKYLEFNNMADFCTPQLLCNSGGVALRTSTGINLPIYRERATTTTLNFGFENGGVCYMNMIPGAGTNTINIKYNNEIYHGVE